MTQTLHQKFAVTYEYPVSFTTDAFARDNTALIETLAMAGSGIHRVLCVVDGGVISSMPGLTQRIEGFFAEHRDICQLVCSPLIIPGGEIAKNSLNYVQSIQCAISIFAICRQSFILGIGGEAVLDMVGFAASTSHLGVRMIRMPTTVLSQDDSGVGVKNSLNSFGKKNFIGTFSPPFAVINDFAFVKSLSHREWISGVAEAIKVALLKDVAFFDFLDQQAEALLARDESAMRHTIYRCAELHARHIATGGDPFESLSSRPLDFGHWSAHKLESLTRFEMHHGEAVAFGVALDCTYSYLTKRLPQQDWLRILSLLFRMGFSFYVSELELKSGPGKFDYKLFEGLEDFREHLGGQLTITLLEGIGKPTEVHKMARDVLFEALRILRDGSWAASLPALCKEDVCEELGRKLFPECKPGTR